jgi:hypothetical protein
MFWSLAVSLMLSPVKEIQLENDPKSMAFLVATPGEMLVTTFDPIQVFAGAEQKLILYSRDGKVLAQASLESLGLKLPTTPVAAGERLLLPDFSRGVIVALDRNLQKQREFVLKGAHPYPYYLRSAAVSPKDGTLFVVGCYPVRKYLDQGCLEVHEFSGENLSHRHSSLELKPWMEEWGVMPLASEWLVGVSPRGEPWVVAEAAGRGFRRPVGKDRWQPLDFGSYAFPAAPYPEDSKSNFEQAYANAALATGVYFFPNGKVAVPYAVAKKNESQVILFSSDGKALSRVTVPGRVVGMVDGHLVAAVRAEATKLKWYRLEGK